MYRNDSIKEDDMTAKCVICKKEIEEESQCCPICYAEKIEALIGIGEILGSIVDSGVSLPGVVEELIDSARSIVKKNT
jgi:hypothetical protein